MNDSHDYNQDEIDRDESKDAMSTGFLACNDCGRPDICENLGEYNLLIPPARERDALHRAVEADESDPTAGLPDDLARVLRDQSIIVPQDAAVWELLAKWQNAPSNTASADLPKESDA